MVGIELPGEDRLPPGAAREMVVALHELYRGAGRPGLRKIAKAIAKGDFPDMVSHETVSDMLNGKSVPRWSKLDCVVRQLALRNAPRLDPEQTAARFLPLWEAAMGLGPEAIRHPVHPMTANVIQLDPGTGNQDQVALPSRSWQDGGPGDGSANVITGSGTGQTMADDPELDEYVELDKSVEWTHARHALIAGQSRWSEPTKDGQTAQVRHLRDNQCSHPSLAAQESRTDRPPTVRVGIHVACNPSAGTQPTSSVIRSSFLRFLSRQPLAGLVSDLTTADPDVKWEKWGGHGRSNHEAILTGADQQAVPLAWARLLLPEPRMPAGWRESHSALLVLHIERRPWETDGPLAPPIPFLDWHIRFTKVLECPDALAGFLRKNLGLDVPVMNPNALFEEYGMSSNPIASVGVWLSAPQAITDLVDISGFLRLPGSPVSPQFDDYAVARAEAAQASDMAIDWMRQMSDNTLHLDDYDSALLGLRASH